MKNVLVTGACGGMGSAVCRLLAENGCSVFGMDIRVPEDKENIRYYAVDVTDEASVNCAAERIAAESGGLDAIVHLAGVYDLNSLVEMPEKDFVRIFNVNLFGVYRVNKAFLDALKPKATLVITSSELAPLSPLPFTGLYGVTKTAVEQYANSLRMELQLLGHRVAVLRPGAVNTGLLGVSTSRLDSFCEKTPHYACNAKRFRAITERVEARSISPEKLAKRVCRIVKAKRPRFVYSINRNPLLLLLNALPKRLQCFIIRKILTPKKEKLRNE